MVVAGQRPANVARIERNSNDPIPEKFILELKRQEEGSWESNSSPSLMMYDVQPLEPCINEAIGNETTEITHVYLTVLTVDCGWVVLFVAAHMSPVPVLQTGHNEYPKR